MPSSPSHAHTHFSFILCDLSFQLFSGCLIWSPPSEDHYSHLTFHYHEFHHVHSHLKMVTSAPKTTWLVSQSSSSTFPVWKPDWLSLGQVFNPVQPAVAMEEHSYAHEVLIQRPCSEKGIQDNRKYRTANQTNKTENPSKSLSSTGKKSMDINS